MFDKSLINQAELFKTDCIGFEKSNLQKAIKSKSKAEVLKFYKEADDTIRSNITICNNVFKINPLAIGDAPETIRHNRSLILCALSHDIRTVKCIPQSLLEDKVIACAYINIDPCGAFIELSDSVLQQKTVFETLMRRLLHPKVRLENISKFINRIFSSPLEILFSSHSEYLRLINRLLTKYGATYKYLPEKLQHNKDIIIKAISSDKKQSNVANILKKIPTKMLSERSFCLKLIAAGIKLRALPNIYKKDLVLCKAAIDQDVRSAKIIDKSLWHDKDFVLYFLKKLSCSVAVWSGNWHTIFGFINDLHLFDEEINLSLVSFGYEIRKKSDFLDCKKLVKAFLDNANNAYDMPLRERKYKSKVVTEYKKISSRLKKDKEIALKAMKMNFQVYECIDPSLKYDIKLLKKVLNFKPSIIERFPKKLKNNKELAIAAMTRSSKVYKHLSAALKNDKQIVELAIKDPLIFRDLPLKFRNDPEVALAAISSEPGNLKHVGVKINSDKEFIKSALLRGASLKYVSSKLKADKDIVMAAVKKYDSNFRFADKTIKEDKEFLLKNFPIHLIFRFCSSKILQDKEIFIEGLNLDTRLIERRGMSPKQMLKMNYEGIDKTKRSKIFNYYKKLSKEQDIFILAKAKSIICGL